MLGRSRRLTMKSRWLWTNTNNADVFYLRKWDVIKREGRIHRITLYMHIQSHTCGGSCMHLCSPLNVPASWLHVWESNTDKGQYCLDFVFALVVYAWVAGTRGQTSVCGQIVCLHFRWTLAATSNQPTSLNAILLSFFKILWGRWQGSFPSALYVETLTVIDTVLLSVRVLLRSMSSTVVLVGLWRQRLVPPDIMKAIRNRRSEL